MADHQIARWIHTGDIGIDPFDEKMIQPASLDVQLGSQLFVYETEARGWSTGQVFGAIDPEEYLRVEDLVGLCLDDDEPFLLKPGQFVLGHTLQQIELPSWIAARVEGKSSLGRLGLLIHSTAGFIDPGFNGNITLEMSNLNQRPIKLRCGMWIAQLSFEQLSPVQRPYGSPDLKSHYQGQMGVGRPLPLRRA